MPSPPIQVFLTSISSNVILRQRQEYVIRILQSKRVQFTSYDLASDEDAKKLWKRKAPSGYVHSIENQQLPGILVGGVCPGTFEELEDAVESGEIDRFFRLNESWDNSRGADAMLNLDQKPIFVPGLVLSSRIITDSAHTHSVPSAPGPPPSVISGVAAAAAAVANASLSSSQKTKIPLAKTRDTKKEGELDASDVLGDPGLHGVSLTDSDIAELAKDLVLDDSDASELVRSIVSDTGSKHIESREVTARTESADGARETGSRNDDNSFAVHETPATISVAPEATGRLSKLSSGPTPEHEGN